MERYDFAAIWAARQKGSPRSDPQREVARWEASAEDYDRRTGVPGSNMQSLAVVERLVRAGDSVLDIGAGTGRFGLPLARRARTVTALDQSPAMLRRFEEKAVEEGLENIRFVTGTVEHAEVEPHDVVLAAWSLYGQVDLLTAIRRLVELTVSVLVIVDGDDDLLLLPHRELVRSIWGGGWNRGLPKHLFYYAALWQIGFHAEVRVVRETRVLRGPTATKVARLLAPADAAEEDLARLVDGLGSRLSRAEDGSWRYAFSHPVEVVIWYR
jgi:SAM-dependent methyltransferase